MALSLGGIMRGALPVATQYLTETPDANAQLINAVGEKFDNIGKEINPKIEAAQTNIDTIEDIANTYGVGTDIVAGLYSATGGKRKETIQQLKNLLDTYGSADLIPVENMPTSTVDITDTQQVNVASAPPMDDESIFQEIASLFKRLGPEEAISAFARQRGITESKVVDFLQGNVGKYIPEYDAKTKLTPDAALAALEAPKDPEKPLVSGGLEAAFYQQLVDKQKDSMNNPGKYTDAHEKLLAAFPTQYLDALKEDNVENSVKLKQIASMFTKILPVDKPKGDIPEKYKVIMETANNIIQAAIGEKVMYDSSLVNELIKEVGSADINYDEVATLVTSLIPTKKVQDNRTIQEEFIDDLTVKILLANEGMKLPEARAKAIEFVQTNPINIEGQSFAKMVDGSGNTVIQKLQMLDTSGMPTIGPKATKEIENKMNLLADAFDSIGSLRTLLLTDDFILGGNNTFATVFSTFRTRAGDIASFFGAPEIAEKLKGPELQNALQQRISFVKRTKEEIFDDPRLSDKDLAIIIDYIGILYDPTISNARALAALQGIEKGLTNAYIKNVSDRFPTLAVAELTPTGNVDFTQQSVAQFVYDQMLLANNIPLASEFAEKANAMPEGPEKEKYKRMYNTKTKYYRELIASGTKNLAYFQNFKKTMGLSQEQIDEKYRKEFVTEYGDGMSAAAIAGKSMDQVYSEALNNEEGSFDAKLVLRSILRRRRGI
tara:strand:- start:229 stop:2385 length:2157 start_codon:yes stop_codon:yes gene_type:complete